MQAQQRQSSIDPNSFHKWTTQHFYKSTYNGYDRGQPVSLFETKCLELRSLTYSCRAQLLGSQQASPDMPDIFQESIATIFLEKHMQSKAENLWIQLDLTLQESFPQLGKQNGFLMK